MQSWQLIILTGYDMARPILSDEEKYCGVCNVPLEDAPDRTEENVSKEVRELTKAEKDADDSIKDKDAVHLKFIRFIRDQRPCYCWRCPSCGMEMTISK